MFAAWELAPLGIERAAVVSETVNADRLRFQRAEMTIDVNRHALSTDARFPVTDSTASGRATHFGRLLQQHRGRPVRRRRGCRANPTGTTAHEQQVAVAIHPLHRLNLLHERLDGHVRDHQMRGQPADVENELPHL